MAIKSAKEHLKQGSIIIVFAFSLLFIFNNCGDVSIGTNASEIVVGPAGSFNTPLIFTALPTPDKLDVQARLIIMIDMTGSMVQRPCVDDIGSPGASARPEPCLGANGSDPDGDRLQLIRVMIEDHLNVPNLKVMLAPFNGVTWQSSVSSQSLINGYYTFQSPQEALTHLMALAQLNQVNKEEAASGAMDSPDRMTTSNPGPAVFDIHDKVREDLLELESRQLQHQAHYEFAFVSDGVISPSLDNVRQAIEVIHDAIEQGHCRSCSGTMIPYLLGTSPHPCGVSQEGRPVNCRRQLEYGNTSSISCPPLDPSDPGSVLREFWCSNANLPVIFEGWGNPKANRTELINAYLASLKGLNKVSGGGTLDFNFYAIRPQLLSADERSHSRNWIQSAKTRFQFDRYLEFEDQLFRDVFFETFPDRENFILKDSWLFNLNTRTDAQGIIQIDSDCDGLFDKDEAQGQISSARSNGRCLDSIATKFGCPVDCDEDVDTDGDSLNQCEEMALGASDYDFDTDGDGIPDLIEVLFSTNAKLNDMNRDDNSDQTKNYQNIQMGLHPLNNPAQVADGNKVRFRVTQNDRMELALQIEHAPLINTLAVGASLPLKVARNVSSLIPKEHQFVCSDQSQNEQSLIVLLSMKGQLSSQKKWLVKKLVVNASSPTAVLRAEELEFFFNKDPL